MDDLKKVPDIIAGMVFLFIGHVVLTGIIVSLMWFAFSFIALLPLLLGISLVQLFYAVPLYRRFKRQRRPYAMKGVVIGALITVLLIGSYVGYLFYQFWTGWD